MNEIQEKILKIVNESIEDTEINLDQLETDLSELGMDSLTFIRIVVTLEEEFDIEVPDEFLLISEMNTIQKIIKIISSVLEGEELVSNEYNSELGLNEVRTNE